jgi:hypothetical protein
MNIKREITKERKRKYRKEKWQEGVELKDEKNCIFPSLIGESALCYHRWH